MTEYERFNKEHTMCEETNLRKIKKRKGSRRRRIIISQNIKKLRRKVQNRRKKKFLLKTLVSINKSLKQLLVIRIHDELYRIIKSIECETG